MSSIIRPEVKCAFKALNQHLKTMFFASSRIYGQSYPFQEIRHAERAEINPPSRPYFSSFSFVVRDARPVKRGAVYRRPKAENMPAERLTALRGVQEPCGSEAGPACLPSHVAANAG